MTTPIGKGFRSLNLTLRKEASVTRSTRDCGIWVPGTHRVAVVAGLVKQEFAALQAVGMRRKPSCGKPEVAAVSHGSILTTP
jgi:hypothetical protein